jgi:hypothetical protein
MPDWITLKEERVRTSRSIVLVLLGLISATAWSASADRKSPNPFARGALYGKVVDTTSGHPIADATVAVQDKHGRVVAWAKTDAQGRYAIGADSLKLLQLHPAHRRGLLGGIVHGIGEVVSVPVRLAGEAVEGAVDVVKQVDPINMARSAVVSAATANPVPMASQMTGSTLNALTGTAQKARANAVKAMLGERQAPPPKKTSEKPGPGELQIVVSAPNYQELEGKAGAYWLERPAAVEERPAGARAWMETVKLAPDKSGKKSEVESMAVLLTDPQVDAPLAPAGTPVKLSVKLQSPAEPPLKLRVFAREEKTGQVAELQPRENGVYSGALLLDPKTSPGETTIAIAALKAEPVAVSLSKSKTDPLLDLAERLDQLEAGKPYDFDPRIMASKNRLDLKLIVLDPKLETPQPPASSPVPPLIP